MPTRNLFEAQVERIRLEVKVSLLTIQSRMIALYLAMLLDIEGVDFVLEIAKADDPRRKAVTDRVMEITKRG